METQETKMQGRWRLFRVPDEFRKQMRRRLHGRMISEDGIVVESLFRKCRTPRRIIKRWIDKGMLLPVAPDAEPTEKIVEKTKPVDAEVSEVKQEAVAKEEPRQKRKYVKKNKKAAAPRIEGK